MRGDGPTLVLTLPDAIQVLRGLMVELAGDDVVAEGIPGKVLRGCFGYSNSPGAFGHNGAGLTSTLCFLTIFVAPPAF